MKTYDEALAWDAYQIIQKVEDQLRAFLDSDNLYEINPWNLHLQKLVDELFQQGELLKAANYQEPRISSLTRMTQLGKEIDAYLNPNRENAQETANLQGISQLFSKYARNSLTNAPNHGIIKV